MPTPNKGEKQKDFMARCMGSDEMVRNYPDSKQRAAVCHSKWEQKHTLMIKYLRICGWTDYSIQQLIDYMENGAY